MRNSTATKDQSKNFGGEVERALARSRVYLILAFGYRYPSVDSLAALREEMAFLKKEPGALSADVRLALERLDAAFRGICFEELEEDYLRVFTHVIASDCHPCETAYTATHLFQQAQKIADLNGFYHAFGVEPGLERSDHVAVELEFMAFLAQKEAFAASRGRPRRISFARDSQRRFLETHLGPWVRAFSRFVEKKAEEGPYAALAALTIAFLGSEFLEIQAQVKEVTGPPKPLPLLMQKEEDDDDDGCPDFCVAEPSSYMKGVLGASFASKEAER